MSSFRLTAGPVEAVYVGAAGGRVHLVLTGSAEAELTADEAERLARLLAAEAGRLRDPAYRPARITRAP